MQCPFDKIHVTIDLHQSHQAQAQCETAAPA
jgi:hypothetical protein